MAIFSFLASLIVSITKFISNSYESYDTYFDKTEEYIYKNIKNGKIFYDLGVIQKKLIILTFKFLAHEYKSPPVQRLLSQLYTLIKILAGIPIINKLLEVSFATRNIYNKYSKHLLISLFLIVFPVVSTSVLLLSAAPSGFFLLFIPASLILLSFETGLFTFIDKRGKNEPTSLYKSFLSSLNNSQSILFLFLLYLFAISLLALFLIFLIWFNFRFFIWWEYNIIMLYISIFGSMFLILATIITILYLTIIVSQAYYFTILEDKDPIQAWLSGIQSTKKDIIYIYSYFLIFALLALFLTSYAFFYLSDIALLIIITLVLHSTFLFAYSIRTTLVLPYQNTMEIGSHLAFLRLYKVSLFVGIIGYTALTSLILRHYPSVSKLYTSLQYERDLTEQFKPFIDKEAGYTIYYPKGWFTHQWPDKSIILHHNANNTPSGRVSATIAILPISKTDYLRLEVVDPGTVILDTTKNETTTKIFSLSLAGHDAIKYTLTKPVGALTEYQINYAIRKEDNIYTISFITADSIIRQRYLHIFDRMIQTFSFTKQL